MKRKNQRGAAMAAMVRVRPPAGFLMRSVNWSVGGLLTQAREGDGWWALQGPMLVYVRLEADDSVQLEMPHFCARCSRSRCLWG